MKFIKKAKIILGLTALLSGITLANNAVNVETTRTNEGEYVKRRAYFVSDDYKHLSKGYQLTFSPMQKDFSVKADDVNGDGKLDSVSKYETFLKAVSISIGFSQLEKDNLQKTYEKL